MFEHLELSEAESGQPSLHMACGPANGPPMLMLHGVTRWWRDHALLYLALTPHWRIFAIDFRGHGWSQPASGQYRVVDYVQDAVRAVKQLSAEAGPLVVYGHSLGAMVAAAAAAQLPQSVRAVVLEDPPFHTMGDRIHQSAIGSYFAGLRRLRREHRSAAAIATALAEMRYGPPGRETSIRLGDQRDAVSLRFHAASLAKLDVEVLDSIVEAAWLDGYDRQSIFSRLDCPTLLLQADSAVGGMLSDADAAAIEAQAADCTRVQFPGVGHAIRWSAFDRLLPQVMGFLESLPEPTD